MMNLLRELVLKVKMKFIDICAFNIFELKEMNIIVTLLEMWLWWWSRYYSNYNDNH